MPWEILLQRWHMALLNNNLGDDNSLILFLDSSRILFEHRFGFDVSRMMLNSLLVIHRDYNYI